MIDLKGLEALLPEAPVLIDVVLADRRPAGFPADRPWLPTHRSIPKAVWLPGARRGALPPDREAAFLDRVAALTGGDKAKPIVTFCRPECWGSWNAGKRLVAAGYTRVHWYPLALRAGRTTTRPRPSSPIRHGSRSMAAPNARASARKVGAGFRKKPMQRNHRERRAGPDIRHGA